MSYVFRDGPFKGAFVRQDFDPRLSVDSIHFQVFVVMEDQVSEKLKMETRFGRYVMLKDCKDKQIVEELRKYVGSLKRPRFSVD